MYPENCYKWSVPWPWGRIHWLSFRTRLQGINFDKFYKYGQRFLYLGIKKLFLKLVLSSPDMYKHNSNLNLNNYMHSLPIPIKMSDEWCDESDQDVLWTSTWHHWLQVEPHQSSKVIRDNLAWSGVCFMAENLHWFQSEGRNVSCRLKMSTPDWSKNRSLLHKITPHRKFH